MKPNNRRFLPIAITAIAVVTVVILFIVPYGSCVRVVAAVNDNAIGIQQCALKKIYAISTTDPEDTVSAGNRVVVLKAFSSQIQIFSVNRTDIGTGNCVMNSPPLPSNLSVNSLLLIRIELRDSAGNLLAQDETTIAYK